MAILTSFGFGSSVFVLIGSSLAVFTLTFVTVAAAACGVVTCNGGGVGVLIGGVGVRAAI